MRSRIRPAFALLAALVLSLGSLATPAAATVSKEWDQAAVTKIAKELASAAGDLRQTVQITPPTGTHERGHRRLRHEALDNLRVIENSINSLASQLEAGQGRIETYPTFRRIRRLRHHIARSAQIARITEPTLSKLNRAGALLRQLEPYYAAEETH